MILIGNASQSEAAIEMDSQSESYITFIRYI